MSKHSGLLLRIGIYCLLSLLAGCSDVPPTVGLGEVDHVEPGQGLVVVRVEANATRIYQTDFLKWGRMFVVAEGSGAPVNPRHQLTRG